MCGRSIPRAREDAGLEVVVATEHCPGPGRTRHYRSSMPHLSGGRGCPSALGGSPSDLLRASGGGVRV
ncbi:hypothetical protein ACKKBG_A20160 [Auxenochlorella protothecoides x Auxenochlorella symbiontica]